ncbi:hypothetical protein [Lysinibacillus phage vB_LspM-01]|nr:hypothetical protein [Lysinibacillus phage vB_LspM-01]
MSNQTEFYNIFRDYIMRSIRTTLPCVVISYDKARQVANLQPSFLMMDDDGKPVKMGMLQDVPVLVNRFEVDGVEKVYVPIYKPGETVFISVADRSIDDLQNGTFLPQSARLFNLNDAIVIGGWNLQ